MKIKKRTEVTIEIEEVVIRKTKEARVAWCHRCAENVRMLEANEAARTAGVSSRAIYREVEAGRLHFVEIEGSILVCLDSLSLVAGTQVAGGDPQVPGSKVNTAAAVIDIAAAAGE